MLDFLDPTKASQNFEAIRKRVLDAIRAERLVLIGSGPLPRKCLAAIRALGGRVPFLVEYEPCLWGREVDGVPVLSPDEAVQEAPERALFIDAIWSPNHCYLHTREWMSHFGGTEILPVPALFWAIPDALGPHYQLAPPHIFLERRDVIERVLRSLGDETSKAQFVSHLRWRVSLDPQHIPRPDRRRMYFDPDLFQLGDNATLADVGAFDGDSLRIFLYWYGARFKSYHAFEPDPLSFMRLSEYCERLPIATRARIHPRQLAAGAEAGKVRFGATGKPGSHAAAAGAHEAVEVDSTLLDEHFASQRLDYLKLDIEGAERAALAGAWRVISRDRPVLATAVYHHPHDIFSVPAEIISRTSGYRYELRSYDEDGIDLVFYAIPCERRIA